MMSFFVEMRSFHLHTEKLIIRHRHEREFIMWGEHRTETMHSAFAWS